MNRKAFTVLEMLVILAIIAILFGIVFPALWQARAGVTASVCLSNQSQIGAAIGMYAQDYDGVLPSMYVISANQTLTVYDIPFLLTPYTKSKQIHYCPDYSATGCVRHGSVTLAGLHEAGTLVTAGPSDDRCMGYGYNFGPGAIHGGGLLGTPQIAPHILSYAGIPLSAVTSPANTFAAGDTYSLVSYSIDPEDIFEAYTGPHRNSALRHRGRLIMLFVDGHARSKPWVGSEGSYGFPANTSDYANWCAEPSAVLPQTNGLTCEQFAHSLAGLQIWWAN